VSTGGVPGAPTGLTISYNGFATTEASYSRTFDAPVLTGNINLGWVAPTTGGPVTGYRAYVAYGASGDFHLLGTVTPVTGTSANQMTVRTSGSGLNDIITALYGASGAEKDPVCTGGYPFINDVCRFQVVAFNGDGESAPSAILSERDSVEPALAVPGGSTGRPWTWSNVNRIMNNNLVLPPLAGSTEAYIGFNEPLSAVNAAGTGIHVGTYEATAASIIMNNSTALTNFRLNTRSIVKVTLPADVVVGDGVSLEAGAVTDLSGNTNIAIPPGAIL